MRAVRWADYLCPWCWLGRDRTDLLVGMGVEVDRRAYELHPEVPTGGVAVRPGGRLDRVLDRIGAECDELGLPFTKPTRSPNTRRALETAEVVRQGWPQALAPLDDALAHAHWVEGEDLEDRELLDRLVEQAGAPAEEVRELVADGVGHRLVDESMAEARERGVTATPAWWVDDKLLIPGAQPREAMARWVGRLIERRHA